MISGMQLLRGITSTNLNHFTGVRLLFSWQKIHITWASHLCQFPLFPGLGIGLLCEDLDRHWGLFLPSVSHCLTYSSLDEALEVMVYQGDGAHAKLIPKAHLFTYSDFFKQKGICIMAFELTPCYHNTARTGCLVPGPFTCPFCFNVSNSSGNSSIPSLSHRGEIQPQKRPRGMIKVIYLLENS